LSRLAARDKRGLPPGSNALFSTSDILHDISKGVDFRTYST
jgi:hypothetical protein